ncbi:hemicentin-2-like protein [Leptotrombidium deliense]|uniref:Hemicentin-2-like protein n=1 Tax=Leptotrombidium deliense TaxID=299467 RepID=A0A443SN73_9ACAR|nr:hemicentin-2-like protein [Leptotrombidium deliense]
MFFFSGKPEPSLVWLKNGSLLDNSWSITPQGIIRNELVIGRLTRKDLMSAITCQASNSNLTKAMTSSITLDLNLRPLDVKITSTKRPLSAGKRVELRCQSRGSRPAAVVTWWKGSKRLQHVTEDTSSHENVTISSVHFTPSIEDNGKMLSCRADHSILPDSALEDSWILDVYYTPRLSLSLGANIHDEEVREFSDVSFECHVQANPRVSQIAWHYNGRPLTTNNQKGIIVKDTSLLLKQVNRDHSGEYRCLAANVEGEGQSKPINLKILYAPICKIDQKTIFGVATREPIQVPCEVEANPKQVTFRWALNNSFKVVEIKNFVSANLRSLASYAPRTNLGYGQLMCWASNKVGEQKEPCVFNVIPAGPPQSVRNCLVGNQSTDSIVVKCESGDDGGLEQSFYLEVFHSASGLMQSNLSSTKSPVFEVQGLPMSTSFLLVLYAANAKGQSNSVTLSASTMPFPNKEINAITPVIAVLIGVVGSLVFTAIAIMMIAKFRGFDTAKGTTRQEIIHVCNDLTNKTIVTAMEDQIKTET